MPTISRAFAWSLMVSWTQRETNLRCFFWVWGDWSEGVEIYITPPKTNMTIMENPPFEDVFPIEPWGFSS